MRAIWIGLIATGIAVPTWIASSVAAGVIEGLGGLAPILDMLVYLSGLVMLFALPTVIGVEIVKWIRNRRREMSNED